MRIVTYNLHGCIGLDGKCSVERVADVLRALEPDVACLQEVHVRLPQSGLADQPARLQALLGMQGRFMNNLRALPGRYGLLTLTRAPVRVERSVRLPNGREGRRWPALRFERRGVLAVDLEAPGGRVTVLNTHWSLDPDDRTGSADAVAALVRSSAGPVVLCGDLNATPDAPEVRRLAEDAGLHDAGQADGAATFPADAPTQRIDYAWLAPQPARVASHTVQTAASDHLPVVVDFEWPAVPSPDEGDAE